MSLLAVPYPLRAWYLYVTPDCFVVSVVLLFTRLFLPVFSVSLRVFGVVGVVGGGCVDAGVVGVVGVGVVGVGIAGVGGDAVDSVVVVIL